MPATSATSATALFKLIGIKVFAGSLAAALGFLVLWPKSTHEGFARLFCTLVASSIFGPVLLVSIYHNWPGMFQSAQHLAGIYQLPPELGLLFVATPVIVVAGLPAWWIIGALLRVFQRDADGVLGAFSCFVKRKLQGG